MAMLAPLVLMVAEPVLTLPPWGRAFVARAIWLDWAWVLPKDKQAKATDAHVKRRAPTKPLATTEPRQPCPLAALPVEAVCSPTATSVPRRLEKMTLWQWAFMVLTVKNQNCWFY
jgi:hypothetical protein